MSQEARDKLGHSTLAVCKDPEFLSSSPGVGN